MPVIFAAHGAPMLLDDAVWMGELAAWAQAMPRPREHPDGLGALGRAPDDAGRHADGAARLRLLRLPRAVLPDQVPGPRRARARRPRPRACCADSGIACRRRARSAASTTAPTCRSSRCIPRADVPVLQISMPGLDARELFELGRALAPLRDEGVLVFGSGFLTHNMRYAFRPGIPAWAREFDAWAADALSRFDVDALARLPRPRPGRPDWPCRRGSTTRRCSWRPAPWPTSAPATTFPITGLVDGRGVHTTVGPVRVAGTLERAAQVSGGQQSLRFTATCTASPASDVSL